MVMGKGMGGRATSPEGSDGPKGIHEGESVWILVIQNAWKIFTMRRVND